MRRPDCHRPRPQWPGTRARGLGSLVAAITVTGALHGCGTWIDEAAWEARLDVDGDSHIAQNLGGDDCDDGDASVHPGQEEHCDGVDDDCDGAVDEDDAVEAAVVYVDEDGDGFGSGQEIACFDPGRHASVGGDCDDAAPLVYPGAPETWYDGTDQDCDGDDDDQDGDGYPLGSDCDDTDPAINPGEVEVCDDGDVDEDCDGAADEADSDFEGGLGPLYVDADGDGYGARSDPGAVLCDPDGTVVDNDEDCDDTDAAVNPAAGNCATGVPTDDARVAIFGEQANGRSGHALAAGDFNGDGVAEIAVGSPGRDEGVGSVSLVFDLPASHTISEADDLYRDDVDFEAGSALASMGDRNGDGFDDLAIGVPGNWANFPACPECGVVYVVDGPITPGASATPGTWVGQWTDQRTRVGESLALAGDFFDEGRDTLVIGAPGFDDTGCAYVPSATSLSIMPAELTLEGVHVGDQAGMAVSGGGDVDGDGLDDVLVGAPGSEDVGAAYLVLGGTTGTRSLSDADAVLIGASVGDAVGAALAVAGDLNGDGLDDLMIGAPDAQGEAGRVYVATDPLSLASLEAAEAIFTGAAKDAAGFAMAAVDLDGDHALDLVIGAPGGNVAYVVEGPAWGAHSLVDANLIFRGPTEGAELGFSLSPAGDVDGDSYEDLLIGDPGFDGGRGASWLYMGGPR